MAKTIQKSRSPQPARFVEPMQCLAVAKLPEGADWEYEILCGLPHKIIRMYAGLYRNQQKNGRIWHKIAEIGRITIGKFTKENPREIVCSHSARRTRRPVLFRPLHPLRSLPLSIGKIRPAHSS